jgi:hypothetical protein
MAEKATVIECAMCGTAIELGKACIGFGIEEPISQSHYFCSEECRSEFVIAETAAKTGINYEIRPIICNGRTLKYEEGISVEDHEALKKGEVINCTDENKEHLISIYMDPFGVVKEF